MKRSLGILIIALGLGLATAAQTTDTTTLPTKKPNPTKQAVRQLKMLQQQLKLSEDQVTQMQVILIHRDVTLDSLRNNPTADRHADGRARRQVNKQADQQINDLLTPDQRPLYAQWKEQQKEKLMEKRKNNNN